LKLFTDVQQQKLLSLPDSTSVLKLGLKEGDPIHIGNTEPSKPQQNLTNNPSNKPSNNVIDPKLNDKKTEKKDDEKNKDAENVQKLISSSWHKKEVKEVKSELDKQKEKEGLTVKCNHPSTSKCLHCMQTPNYKGNIKFNCLHGPTGKCPNCVTKDVIEDVKHISFDEFLAKRQAKCKGTHDPNSKCNNCTPPLEHSYKFNRNCNKHAPYPEGLCGKCIPPAVSLGSQHYRHVDYVSFMNFEEINLFVQQWQKDHCLKQRMAYLFGYFAEDPNYPNGIRAVVEAIYEPKQIGDHDSVQPLDDKNDYIVDAISNALTLEFIGWMFTTINTDKEVLMCSYDIKKAAIYQEQYKVKHSSGNWVSKFITVMVKPKEDGNVGVECCMVSDSFQALVRDGIIGDCVDKAIIPIRKAEKNEVLPDIFQESKKVESFDPAFAIVSVSNCY
jgi:nuclear protein localization family protein 4